MTSVKRPLRRVGVGSRPPVVRSYLVQPIRYRARNTHRQTRVTAESTTDFLKRILAPILHQHHCFSLVIDGARTSSALYGVAWWAASQQPTCCRSGCALQGCSVVREQENNPLCPPAFLPAITLVFYSLVIFFQS